MNARFFPLLLAAAALLCVAGARKPQAPAIRFHAESHVSDGELFSLPVTVGNPPREIHVEKMPMITEREVVAFHPFAAQDDSGTYGVYLQLDNHGTKTIHQITTEKRQALLVPMVNGRAVSVLRIDRPVRDGILSIPAGLSGEEIYALGQRFSAIGETAEETKQRQTAQRLEYQDRMRRQREQ